jgi:hypothetical protein
VTERTEVKEEIRVEKSSVDLIVPFRPLSCRAPKTNNIAPNELFAKLERQLMEVNNQGNKDAEP